MAHVDTPTNKLTYVSFPIEKFERDEHGDLYVWGKATDGSVDSDEQIVDPAWSAKALEKWLTTGGNVRVMHSPKHLPAGKGVELDTSTGDGHWVRSKVVEPTAKRLVEEKVLLAYSVGISNPKIVRDRVAKGGRIVGGDIHELSLVDRPANKNCGITLVKSADGGVKEETEELFGSYSDLLGDTEPDDVAKGAAPFAAEDEEPSDDATDSAEDDADDDEDDPEKAYAAAVTAHKAAEPTVGSLSAGPTYLAKRAAWQQWSAEGEANGLDGTPAGYGVWWGKRAAATAAAEDGDALDLFDLGGADVAKGEKDCPSCGKGYDSDAKTRRCEGCGKKLPKVKAEKAARHREPTTPDKVPDKVPASVKSATVPYTVKRMHDATCAAFHWDTVAEVYPSLKGVADAAGHVAGFFADQVTALVAKGDMAAVADAAGLAAVVDDIAKGAYDPAAVAAERAELHKMFADLHPTAGVSPGHITPGQFQRPYVSAGHAPLVASRRRPLNVPAASHTIDPDDFDRDLITAGHQAESPADMGDNLATPTLGSGAARTYYRNASREAARMAMQAMHDHIAGTFPDMCPMAASVSVLPPDMGDKNRPRRAEVPDSTKAPGEKAHHKPGLAKVFGKKDLAKIVKSAVREATETLAGIHAAESDLYKSQIAALQAEIDELGAQPDPAQAPLRGVVRKAATSEPAPVDRVSLAEKAMQDAAETERRNQIEFAAKFLQHHDPAKREWAEDEIARLQAT